MIYVIAIQSIIFIAVILKLKSILDIKILEMDGIPLTMELPSEKIEVMEEKNYVICLSIFCPHCRKILDDLEDVGFITNNIFVIFSEEENEVREHLSKYKTLNFEYLPDILNEDVYIKTTPFVYVLDANKIIIDKKVVKTISSFDIV